MKRRAWKTLVLAVGIVLITLIAGCEEEANLPDTKRGRLIAAENMRLQKELERRDKENKQQQGQLEKCLQEKNAWKEKAQQSIRKQVDSVLTAVMEKIEELSKENESLKAQIEQLKAELEEAKKLAATVTS